MLMKNPFTCGENYHRLLIRNTRVAVSICYELSVPEHSQQDFEKGAEVYIASVAKLPAGTKKAHQFLQPLLPGMLNLCSTQTVLVTRHSYTCRPYALKRYIYH